MKKPLIARVFGGLGNQMFIYANARAITLKNDSPLFLDNITGFKGDPYKRSWELDHFGIEYKTANKVDSLNFICGRLIRKVLREFNQRILTFNYITEKNYERFDPAIKDFNIQHKTWIEGYWQSPKYFEEFRNTLCMEFATVKSPISDNGRILAKQMKDTCSVCLHARRLRNELVGEENAKIKTLSLSYYKASIEKMVHHYPDAHFFCFSDAPEWLKDNLKIDYPVTFVSQKNTHAYEDIWLMQQCKHFIISNSTFSWWPAWLGEASDKLVLSPGLAYWDCKDILPQDWHIIHFE